MGELTRSIDIGDLTESVLTAAARALADHSAGSLTLPGHRIICGFILDPVAFPRVETALLEEG